MATQKTDFASLNLHHNIAKAIAICGYTDPTPIQAQSIPPILENQDIVACAQTGSGKTAAFVLPALHLLSTQPAAKQTRILILTPTRELASQITKAARLYGKFLNFNIVNLVGGMPYHHQIKDLARGADIIVATPGRLLDHIEQGRVNLSHVQMLVLDEADRMLDMGFIDDVKYIAKLTPAARQTLLFSATIGKGLADVIKTLLKNPVKIDLSHKTIAAPQIKQELYRVTNMQQKNRLLKHLLEEGNIFKAIIFSATKINADKLANQLRDDGFAAAALHGDLRQNVRNRTVEQLRNGKIQFLVATDVAARGIDICDVTHVINYDLPRASEDYVHRIGRTGRAGKSGMAISFVGPTDSRHLQNIERYLGQRIKLAHLDTNLLAGKHEKSSKAFMVDDRDAEDDGDYQRRKPKHEFSAHKKRFDKRERDERSFDKPKKSKRDNYFDDTKRDKRSFDRNDRKSSKSSEDRIPFTDRERGDRSFDRGDRKKRRSSEDRIPFADHKRNDRSFDRNDRKKRKSSEDRIPFADRERSDRSFDRNDRKKRKFSDDRIPFADRERNDRSFDRKDKPKRKFGENKKRFDDNTRGERTFEKRGKPKPKFGASNDRRKSTTEKKRFDNVGGRAIEGEPVRAFKKRSINKDRKFSHKKR